MFKTYVGATATEDDVAYLRPETAQGIFVQFKNVVDTTRVKVPFGIAQIGKASATRSRRATSPSARASSSRWKWSSSAIRTQARDWYAFWREQRMKWWQGLGLAGENLQLREHDRDELAHYAKEGAGTSRYRIPLPVHRARLRRAGGRGASLQLRSGAASEALAGAARILRQRARRIAAQWRTQGRALPAACDRAGRGPGSRCARAAVRGLHRRSRARQSGAAAAESTGCADQGGRVPAGQQGRHAGDQREAVPGSAPPSSGAGA